MSCYIGEEAVEARLSHLGTTYGAAHHLQEGYPQAEACTWWRLIWEPCHRAAGNLNNS